MVGSFERITDVAPTLYIHGESRRPIENSEQIVEDLWTWWAEASLRPSPIRLYTHSKGLNDKYGNNLLLQAKAASIIRKGRVEKGRVDAEVLGVERLERLLLSREVDGGVIYISPPGTEEEGFGAEGRRRLSFTYLYHVGNAGRIHFLAIPELEVSTTEHLKRIREIVDLDRTERIVGDKLHEVDNRALVSYPLAVKDPAALDRVAQHFGYKDLLDMWKIALESKRLDGKVGELITHASEMMWNACQAADSERLEVLGDVFRGVVALIVSNDLNDVVHIKSYFNTKVEAMMQVNNIDRNGGSTAALYQQYHSDLREFYFRLRNNKQAMGIVEGGSCPGDRGVGLSMDMFGRWNEVIASNNVMLDVLDVRRPFGESNSSLLRSEAGSTGKYKDFYEYKPGICAHCHEHKQYVAYPKDSETACAGWCSECEY